MQLSTALDSTLGAAFLGTLAAAIFYGLTSVQTFIYFQNCAGDGRFLKSWVFTLWILDTVHMAFTAHGVYFYLVTNFGNFEALAAPTWSILAGVYLTNISDIIVRSIFAKRISILCGLHGGILRILLPVLIVILSLVVFICGCAFASRAFILHTFARLDEASVYIYASIAAGVAADSTIAISLCILLFKSRTELKRTDSILNILMAFSINTALLTSICALACLITYAIWPQRLIFVGIYFTLSKLFVNSLLASLNSRGMLRSK
ncbi:hypothetical protein BDZ97DRAFT_1733137, partial [Flammula alnicola]